MNRSPLANLLHRLAEEAIPPAEVDLWPAVRSHLERRKAHPKGDFSMKRSFAQNWRLRFIAVPILALLLIAAILVITPQGRAWAQSALQFFTRAESDTLPAPTPEPLVWVEQTPGVPAATITPLPPMAPFAADCGDYREPRCSVEQMRSKVDFTVKELATIPAGMYFIGATGGPEEVFIKYDSVDQSAGLFLFEQPWTGSLEQKSFEVAPGVEVEEVPVGGATGEYVQGSFGYTAGETEETWMSDNGLETLRWVDQDTYYTLRYMNPTGTPLGKERLAILAYCLTTEPVSANLTPIPGTITEIPTLAPNRWNARYPLSPAQASEQAGFDVWVPSKMPGSLAFIGIHYDAEHNLVRLFYPLNCGEDCGNSLYLEEQPAPNGEDCDLCGFFVGDEDAVEGPRHAVGTEATIEAVQIGDVTGQYVKGDWVSNNVTGFEWENDWYTQRLLWKKDGMAFLLYDGTWGELEKEDLITIAESMIKAQVEADTPVLPATATPEVVNYRSPYTLTIAQAEEQAGFDLRVPGVLPEGLSLEGAHYDAERHTVSLLYRAGPEEPSFSISEQPISSLQDCAICGIKVGDINTQDESYRGPKLVGANATIETIQIGEITGLYVEGVWQAIGDTGQWGWEPYPEVAHMRWQQGGMAFALSSYLIDQEDLITIAESIP